MTKTPNDGEKLGVTFHIAPLAWVSQLQRGIAPEPRAVPESAGRGGWIGQREVVGEDILAYLARW